MRTTLRYVPSSLLAVLGAAFSPVAASDAVPLPVVQELAAEVLTIELRGSRVDVLIDDEATPTLRVFDLVKGEKTEGFVLLKTERERATLSQTQGSDSIAPRLAVEIVMGTEHRLIVRGDDLELGVRGSAWLEEGENDAAPPSNAELAPLRAQVVARRTDTWLDFDLTRGNVTLNGITDAYITGVGTNVFLDRTRGLIDLAIDRGSLEAHNHQGGLVVRGIDSHLSMRGSGGAMRFGLLGGSMLLYNGTGALEGTSDGSEILIEAWQGGATLRGENNSVRIISSGTASESLSVSGADNRVQVDDFAGKLIAQLVSGELDVRGLGGSANVQGDSGARVKIFDVEDSIQLTLKNGASGDVRNVGRSLRAKIKESALDVTGSRGIQIDARDSLVTVSGEIGRLKLTMQDGEGSLDLTDSPSTHDLELKGRASVSVELTEPCAVRLKGETAEETVRASGCDLIGASGTSRKSSSSTSRTSSRPAGNVTLVAGPDTDVDVFGRP